MRFAAVIASVLSLGLFAAAAPSAPVAARSLDLATRDSALAVRELDARCLTGTCGGSGGSGGSGGILDIVADVKVDITASITAISTYPFLLYACEMVLIFEN